MFAKRKIITSYHNLKDAFSNESNPLISTPSFTPANLFQSNVPFLYTLKTSENHLSLPPENIRKPVVF